MIMKKIFAFIAIAIASVSIAKAGDRPVTFNQLPAAAQSFITMNFPDEKISYATKDDDFVLPEYTVVFVNGMKIQFRHAGEMESIQYISGVPANLVPSPIMDYVRRHYPDTIVIEYEIGRKSYDVKLSNRLELKFSKSYNLIEIDD